MINYHVLKYSKSKMKKKLKNKRKNKNVSKGVNWKEGANKTWHMAHGELGPYCKLLNQEVHCAMVVQKEKYVGQTGYAHSTANGREGMEIVSTFRFKQEWENVRCIQNTFKFVPPSSIVSEVTSSDGGEPTTKNKTPL